jgi:hypothetical protein
MSSLLENQFLKEKIDNFKKFMSFWKNKLKKILSFFFLKKLIISLLTTLNQALLFEIQYVQIDL